jgi:hypothetical protein
MDDLTASCFAGEIIDHLRSQTGIFTEGRRRADTDGAPTSAR